MNESIGWQREMGVRLEQMNNRADKQCERIEKSEDRITALEFKDHERHGKVKMLRMLGIVGVIAAARHCKVGAIRMELTDVTVMPSV